MKIVIHGPASGLDWHGMVSSWAPDQPVDIDDADRKAVAWARVRIGTGLATLVEDVKRAEPRPAKPAAEKPAR
jgi:hypothetical protein